MDTVENEFQRLIAAKEIRRKVLAALPYSEKVRILIQMQKIVAPILRARGRNVCPWDIDSDDRSNRE